MALDATVGGSSSNSYATRVESTTYFADGVHPKHATWTALDDNDKDEYLIMATTHIDMLDIKGGKSDTTTTSGVPDQALKFPRAADYDGGEFIPVEVKKACYEQAIYLAEKMACVELRADLQRAGVKSASIGGAVSETFGGVKDQMLCSTAYRILLNAGLIQITAAFL